MAKRILIFSTAYLPLVGGAEIAVKELTDRLAGFNFDLITARLEKKLAKQEKIGQVTVYRVGLGCKFDKFLLPWLGANLARKLHRVKKYDLIWAIMASFGGLAALFFKKKNLKTPYLLTLQEGDTPEHIYSRAKWLGPYYKKMFTQADFITAISRYLKDFGLEQGATAPIAIVPNGVNVEKFNLPAGGQKLKSELNIKDSEKIIITVSRLVKKNGVGDIIEAMRYLPVNVKLLIIGTGELELNLKSQISNLKLADRVIMLGEIKNEEVPGYLSVADVFIRPSLSEGQGIAFLEAMAAGLPVIATPVGGIVDFLRDGETGLFCEARNPKSIALKIEILSENKELTDAIKINARELVIKNYNWDLIAKKMESIFSGVLERRP